MQLTTTVNNIDASNSPVIELKSLLYTIGFMTVVVIVVMFILWLTIKYVIPIVYRLIYRNYLDISEENLTVIDVRIYGRKDERLVVENEDMDRFIIEESKYDIAVSGDVVTGYKEYNAKTGSTKYFYNKSKVYEKNEKGNY